MDVKIRGVEAIFLAQIDKKCNEISERRGEKFSRNDYLKMLIHEDARFELIELQRNEFNAAVDSVEYTMNKMNEKLQEYIDVTNMLVLSLTGNIDLESYTKE